MKRSLRRTTFFTNVSHEFRTPLSLIYGPVKELARDESLGDKERELVGIVDRNAERMIRLTDLYLLYCEAINEAEGPNGAHSADLFKYLDAIRERAGIPGVKKSWDEFSNNPGYYNTQPGMREILHRERQNELVFESQRFWDIRRW